MNIQIFGTGKCKDTRKAQRWFKERGIRFQDVDLGRKGMSAGELRSVAKAVGGMAELIDSAGRRYAEKGLTHARPTGERIEAALLADPLLLRTPVVRNGRLATVGHAPEVWADWS